jgi:hypothetical protein
MPLPQIKLEKGIILQYPTKSFGNIKDKRNKDPFSSIL